MLVERNIEQVEKGCQKAYAELLKAIPEYGPAPPHGWRVYRCAIGPMDEVVIEIEWASWAEREAWWKSWHSGTPSQKEWYDKRKPLVSRSRSEIWEMDRFG